MTPACDIHRPCSSGFWAVWSVYCFDCVDCWLRPQRATRHSSAVGLIVGEGGVVAKIGRKWVRSFAVQVEGSLSMALDSLSPGQTG